MAENTATVGNSEFDWSAIGKKQDNYSSDDRNKMDELYEKTLKTITDLQLVEGIIVASLTDVPF